MAVKQISINALEWIIPVLRVKKSYTALKKEFASTTAKYDPLPYDEPAPLSDESEPKP